MKGGGSGRSLYEAPHLCQIPEFTNDFLFFSAKQAHMLTLIWSGTKLRWIYVFDS